MGGLKPNHTGNFIVVSDGIMGKDYDFQEKTDSGVVLNLLTVKTPKPISISGRLKDNEGCILIETKNANITLINLEMTDIVTRGYNEDCSPIVLAKGCSATLELRGTNILHTGLMAGQCGIGVAEGTELTIKGPGNLDAKASIYGAAIGGSGCAAGKITIESGTIYLSGGQNGIGGGARNHSGGGRSGGTIIIKGGHIFSEGSIGGLNERNEDNGSFTLDGDAVVYCRQLNANVKNLNKGFLFAEVKDGINQGYIYGTPKIQEPWELLKNSSLTIPKGMENSIKIEYANDQVTVTTIND